MGNDTQRGLMAKKDSQNQVPALLYAICDDNFYSHSTVVSSDHVTPNR